MKRTIICLMFSLLLLLAACNSAGTGDDASVSSKGDNAVSGESIYTPGTYEGKGSGFFGDVVMSVTFSDNAITQIETVTSNETMKLVGDVFKIVPEAIIETQNLTVDTVSGATFASKAVLGAVKDAATKAAVNGIDHLMVALPPTTPGEKIEKTCDVLVIGGGGAGLSAAATAVENGANVILLEKNAFLGGNTLASGGAWNAADVKLASITDTKPGQLNTLKSYLGLNEADYGAAGETLKIVKEQITKYLSGDTSKMFDSAELHTFQTYIGSRRQSLNGEWYNSDFEMIKTLCENSVETRNWIVSLGGQFSEKVGEPSGAYWSRASVPIDMRATFVDNLVTVIESNGSEIIKSTEAYELLTEGNKVVGAKARKSDGTEVEIRSDATIMTTGGYGSNIPMVIETDNYWGILSDSMSHTTITSTVGDGIKMAEAVNAKLEGMGFTQLNKGYKTTGMHAKENGLNAMFLTPEGTRFVNEYAARDVYSKAAFKIGGTYYCLMNQADELDDSGIYDTYRADNLEDICKEVGMDPEIVRAEIEKYNSYVDSGIDPEFGKNVFGSKITGPYALKVWVPIVHHTMGGLKINAEAEVLDTEGNIIPGLYAAGEVTGGIHGGNRLGGNAIADAFVFGRIAGANSVAVK